MEESPRRESLGNYVLVRLPILFRTRCFALAYMPPMTVAGFPFLSSSMLNCVESCWIKLLRSALKLKLYFLKMNALAVDIHTYKPSSETVYEQ